MSCSVACLENSILLLRMMSMCLFKPSLHCSAAAAEQSGDRIYSVCWLAAGLSPPCGPVCCCFLAFCAALFCAFFCALVRVCTRWLHIQTSEGSQSHANDMWM